jgi:hypothetical protein
MDCFIHHYGSQSFVAAEVDYHTCLRENWEIFKRKWGIPATVEYGAAYDLTPHLESLRRSDLIFHPLPGRERMTMADAAAALWQRGRREEAVARLAQSLRESRDDRETVWQLGQYLHDLGHVDQAARLYAGYLERHRGDAPMRDELAGWQGDQASPSASRAASPAAK